MTKPLSLNWGFFFRNLLYNREALWLYWEPSYPSQSSGLLGWKNATLASFNSTPRLRGSLHPRRASGVLRPPFDGQRSQTVGFLQFNIAASWESAPSRSFGCAQAEERNIGVLQFNIAASRESAPSLSFGCAQTGEAARENWWVGSAINAKIPFFAS